MTPHPFKISGHELLADPSGALVWPAQKLIVFSDLHFGKGNALAARGDALLPPYDAVETLNAVEDALDRYDVSHVISLGDSFDRADIGLRAPDLARLVALTKRFTWIWVRGNHDPALPHLLAGDHVMEKKIKDVSFRHEAQNDIEGVEISGHYHPKAAVRLGGRRIRSRCFVHNGTRLIVPAFGTYTGGLDITDEALTCLIGSAPHIYLCQRERVYPVPADALCA